MSDDSRLRLIDDVAIAPDGRIFFSEASKRYDQEDWRADALECRGNGRLLRFDPATRRTRTVLRGLVFPSGLALAEDGQSLLFSESWTCRVQRYWFDGPRKGQVQTVLDNLPGHPAKIRAASDGSYWLAIMGMRTPALDLALAMPDLRRRMARRVAPDLWLCPNVNLGCVLRFNSRGDILESLWDPDGLTHAMVTSAREHAGRLYIGGVASNRIGALTLAAASLATTVPAAFERAGA
jgi:ribose transport system permease protein